LHSSSVLFALEVLPHQLPVKVLFLYRQQFQ
jgi:hypothetical protein